MANYIDLTRTNFPNSLDDRPTAIEVVNRNAHFKLNVNFEDRTSTTDPTDYVVLADDVNALQESMIAVQRSLGVMPQGSDINYTVERRVGDIEDFVLMSASIAQGYTDLDQRYMWGGARPSVSGTPVPLISIKGHVHSGAVGQADKINIATDVTGTLGKQNIDLTSATPSMLSAQDIRMGTANTTTLPEALNEKMDKGGGTFAGSVSVGGNFKSLTHIELDAKDLPYTNGCSFVVSGSDIEAFSGYARTATITSLNGTLASSSHTLRYGQYVAIFRMRCDNIASSQVVAKLRVKPTAGEELLVKPSDFTLVNKYKNFYLEFVHEYAVTAPKTILLGVDFYTGIAGLSIDSIVVTPITTALYDDDIS